MDRTPRLTARPVAGSVDELLAGASWRGPMDKHVDSLSGSLFERAIVGGEPCVVKHIGYDVDWLARALDDRDCWALTMWRTGLLDALPDRIDHTVLGMARDDATRTVAVLMRDVGEWLVPAGSAPLAAEWHLMFLDHMARMHVEFWGFHDEYVAWYLAVNCDRLPMSKEDTIVAFRRRLEEYGVPTAGWWDRQLNLALLGAFLQLGWSKTGDPVELGWWVERVLPVARELHR
jgi:hypothetical protein